VLRALEIYYQSGKRRSELSAGPDRFAAAKFFLDPETAVLERLIRERTEAMFREGWIQEVRDLLVEYPDFRSFPASRSLGYPEVLHHIAGEISLEECRVAVIRKTLQYAKRQRTWFRHQDGYARVENGVELRQRIDSVLQ
jgi:tRNA dimethylallyltransferase